MSTDLSTPRTLYLLDDNDDFRATAKWWLSGAGYDVIDFGDAQAAIDALAALDAAALTRACLLLDYSGCGESDGDFADGTLSRWREEVLVLIDAKLAGQGVVLVDPADEGEIPALKVGLARSG